MTSLCSEISDKIIAGFQSSFEFTDLGDSVHVAMPQTFSSGALLSVEVAVFGDRVEVTDRGLAADQLHDLGIDINRGAGNRSFQAVINSTGLSPAFNAEPWEITASAERGDIAIAIQAVADAAMRADGLSALARAPRKRSFADRIVHSIGELNLQVVPKAPILGRHGGKRQVTARVDVREQYYLQALPGQSAQQRMDSYDHASGLFLDAVPSKDHRVAVIEEGKWEAWQVSSLKQICKVTDESELPQLLERIAS
ncbi:hypothetical protein R4282_32360 [Rhodococcus oxybenzonivorans]|uniref:hypothetical protein n=1 Tax=Rhodococcus oxybenzonivorans TaxID=1990687 RepID=UPI0029532182|nr:hypothetical protein [Rhodococcus oxybenzonivorans]MDV7357688.1 hypothetical protein [Rhodococcus oxybenzonivorans]